MRETMGGAMLASAASGMSNGAPTKIMRRALRLLCRALRLLCRAL